MQALWNHYSDYTLTMILTLDSYQLILEQTALMVTSLETDSKFFDECTPAVLDQC